MSDFLEVKSLNKQAQKKIVEEIKKRIEEKKKAGLLTERDIREIEEMRLHTLPDIQDVQNVYESHLYKKEK